MDKSLIKTIIAGFGFILVAGLVWLLYNWISTLNKGTLRLSVIPSDATVLVDDSTKTKPGDIHLSPGLHSLTISRDGFNAKLIRVTIRQKETISQSVILSGNSKESADYFSDNQDEQAAAESAAGAKLNAESTIITQNNPIIRILPYQGSNYRIDYGVSLKYASNPEAVAIYVTYNKHDESGKINATKWISAQGYDPAALEIIYQLSN